MENDEKREAAGDFLRAGLGCLERQDYSMAAVFFDMAEKMFRGAQDIASADIARSWLESAETKGAVLIS